MTLRWKPPDLGPQRKVAFLTPRMADVLTGLCWGYSNAEIGRRLFITPNSVKTHMRRLFREVGARDRTHCVALAVSGQVEVYVHENAWRRTA